MANRLLTLGAPGGWTPRHVMGLKLWLDASRITGLSDGDAVSQWNDLSGNGNHASQGTGANQPIFKQNIQNTRPTVRFNGSSHQLVVTHNSTLNFGTSGFTVFAVAAHDTVGATDNALLGKYQGANDNWRLYHRGAGTFSHRSLVGGNVIYDVTGGTYYVAASTFCIYTNVTAGSTRMSLFRNGGAEQSEIESGGSIDNTGNLSIGAWNDSIYWDGDIAELLIYARELTKVQRRRVEMYLSRKWGIIITRQVIEDTFTRADNASSLGNAETGEAWTIVGAGTYGIIGNQAYHATQVDSYEQVLIDTGLSDCTISCTIATYAANQEIVFRQTDQSNFLIVELQAATYKLWKRVLGVFTALGTYSAAPADGDVVRIVLSGTSMNVFINGTSRITATDSFNQVATKHGISYGNSGARWDNFVVEV